MVVKAKTKSKAIGNVRPDTIWPFPTPGVTKKKVTAKKPTPTVAHGIAANSMKHAVMATLNNVELAKAKSALSLDLYANGKKIGNLEAGQGSFFWTGARRKKSKPIDWTKFSEMMNHWAYEK